MTDSQLLERIRKSEAASIDERFHRIVARYSSGSDDVPEYVGSPVSADYWVKPLAQLALPAVAGDAFRAFHSLPDDSWVELVEGDDGVRYGIHHMDLPPEAEAAPAVVVAEEQLVVGSASRMLTDIAA